MANATQTTTAALEVLLMAVQEGRELTPKAADVRQAYAALGSELNLTPAEAEEYIADRNLRSRLAA